MAEPFDQIGTAIPFGILPGISLHGTALEEEKLPAGDQRTDVEWERQFVFQIRRIDRPARHHESIDGADVLVSHARHVIVGECRIEVMPVAPDAVFHRAPEGCFRPPANAAARCGVMLVE